MIWIICAITSALLLVVGVKLVLGKKQSVFRLFLTLFCFFAAAYALNTPLFITAYGVLSGLVGALIKVLQIVAIDSDVLDFYEIIKSGTGNMVFCHFYVALLGIIHILLPMVSAFTAVTVLFKCFSSLRVGLATKKKRPMFVFSEINERSLQLAKSLSKIKCDIVFADAESSNKGEMDESGRFIFKDETISEINIGKIRKGKSVYFFCISENEDETLSQSLKLIEKYETVNETVQERIHIFEFTQNADFSVFIDSANKGLLDVQCFNEYEMLIYELLDKYPLYKFANSEIHVLLHGFTPLNIIALKAVNWCGQLSGFSLKVSVVGININNSVEDLKLSMPGLFSGRYNVNFYDCQNEKQVADTVENYCADANYIIVSEETDNETMNSGLLLRRVFYKLDKDFKYCPPIFCHIKEQAKGNIVRNLATAESNPKRKMSYDLIPFGNLSEVYTYENLVDSNLEKLAKNVHLAYEEIFSNGEIDVKEAIKRYNVFEVNKRSNRANALHIRYKLNLLGLDYTDGEAEPVRFEEHYSDELLECLARSEHSRWMAFLETEGWIPSEKADVYAYRESGISKGRHNCPLLKMHPYICEYEELRELSMDLEGKDTTVYDKELVLRIPDILGDKWNVAGKKFTITKL